MKFIFGIVFASLLTFSIFSLSYGADNQVPPHDQLKQGVLPEDVTCKENLVLLIKNNGNPACVKEDHVFRLLQSGWADKVVPEKESVPVHSVTSDTWNDQDNPALDDSARYFVEQITI